MLANAIGIALLVAFVVACVAGYIYTRRLARKATETLYDDDQAY